MALITSNAAECALLDKMLKSALVSDENYILKLFRNDYTPDDNYAAASFTEANFTNYAAKTLTRSAWASAAVVSSKAQTSYATQSWTCGSSGNTIYGMYVVGSSSGTVLWSERFGSTRVVADQDVLSVTPTFTLNHE